MPSMMQALDDIEKERAEKYQILKELKEMDPMADMTFDTGTKRCFFCLTSLTGSHAINCLWRRAQGKIKIGED